MKGGQGGKKRNFDGKKSRDGEGLSRKLRERSRMEGEILNGRVGSIKSRFSNGEPVREGR